jgi:hypothetical protein
MSSTAEQVPALSIWLQLIFDLFNRVYAELEDSASPHFQLCMSILETVAQVGACSATAAADWQHVL